MEQKYNELCNRVTLPGSQNLIKIWKILLGEDEAALALLLPGSSQELSAKIGKSAGETEKMLQVLYKKGVAFKSKRDAETKYKLARDVTQLHDATIGWDGATQELYDLWVKVFEIDMPALINSLPADFTMPTSVKIVPVNISAEPGSSVINHQECIRLVEEATRIAVVKCPCRLSQKACDRPIETCIQINRGADYALDRGHGRELTKKEAIKILDEAARAGLVHVAENRDQTTFICNCCDCCCISLKILKATGKKWLLAPSRYIAEVSADDCIACGDCVDICPFDAISMDDVARVDMAKCMGCGVCAVKCSVNAIALKETRP